MLDVLNDILWGYVLIYGLIAAGLAVTIAARFLQFRYFGAMFGVLRGGAVAGRPVRPAHGPPTQR